MKFKSDIEVQAGLKDSSGSAGSSGQILTSTGTQTFWVTTPITPGTGGSSQVFYFNGSIASSVAGYQQMSSTAYIGTGTDFSINADGYIASFLTDVNSPNQLNIPAGNWNFEIYMSASSGGGSPSFYVELYKYSSSTFTLIASSSATPEGITNGTAIDLYITALAVPATALLVTDRLAVRVYVLHSSKTITMHTQDSHLCEVITTFSTGISALNGLTPSVQYFATNGSGADFNIVSSGSTHTFNLPTASSTKRGALSSTDWTIFNSKAPDSGSANYIQNGTTLQTANFKINGAGALNILNIGSATMTIDNEYGQFYIGNQDSSFYLGDSTSLNAMNDMNIYGAQALYLTCGAAEINYIGTYHYFNSKIIAATNLLVSTGIDDGINKLQVNGYAKATGYRIPSGLSTQFLKADGTVDSNTYLTTSSASTTYAPISGSANYIQASPSSAQSANMWISGIITSGISGTTQGQITLHSITANAEGNIYGRNGGGMLFNTNANAHPIEFGGSLFKVNPAATFASSVTATSFSSTLGSNFATSSGNVGIGTTTPHFSAAGRTVLDINGTSNSMLVLSNGGVAGSYLYQATNNLNISNEISGDINLFTGGLQRLSIASSGAATFASSVTATGFFNSSDSRLKDIISQDGDTVEFTWKDKRDDKKHIGYIAQEVQKTYPDQVSEGSDGMLSVNYIEILVAKIQVLENRIKILEK